MSSRQPVALNAMLCPHCMSVNDVAAASCSTCGSPFAREAPGLAPLAAAPGGAPRHGALAARTSGTAAANEPVRDEGTPAPAEAHAERFDRVHVVFRDDGSAMLEYSEAPPGEVQVDEPAPAKGATGAASPTTFGADERAIQLAGPGSTGEASMATAAPATAGQWAAGPASMTAFVVGAAVATLVLVAGYLVYRSLAPSGAPAIAAPPPSAAIFDGRLDAGEAVPPDAGQAPPPAARVAPIAPPALSRRQPPAAITDGGRPAASTTVRASPAAPAPRTAPVPPPPPVNVPCDAAVAALGLCTPTEPGRP
jgi:hypothetical protein